MLAPRVGCLLFLETLSACLVLLLAIVRLHGVLVYGNSLSLCGSLCTNFYHNYNIIIYHNYEECKRARNLCVCMRVCARVEEWA